MIYWSHVWKLTTVAVIPYYTGQYKNSKRGFGFVTIGANVGDFHKAASQTKKRVEVILQKEEKRVEQNIAQITNAILENINKQIFKVTLITVLLIIVVIYVAIYISNNIAGRINKIILGTQKLKENNFDFELDITEKDEIGRLKHSFNDMAKSIKQLTTNLENKLYTDELTKLGNRRAFAKDLQNIKHPVVFLLDIDSFKHINDYYGTAAGNFVLMKFATLLQEFCNQNDAKVYRMSSDEFLILSEREILVKGEEAFIKELADTVAKERFANEDLSIDTNITFSCGIADGEGNLLEKSDLALAEATRRKIPFLKYNAGDPPHEQA